jgi:Protein of unknown function (DUF1488)
MLGGMFSLCSSAMCLRTISEYKKRSPQMRQCHWSRAKMYGRHRGFSGRLWDGAFSNPVNELEPQFACSGHLTDACSSELTDIDLSTWHNEIPSRWSIAMPLQRGEVQRYDFDRMTVDFTMLNQGKVIMCAISTAAMDNIEGTRDVRPDQRIDQFMRLRDVIEERASRKFFEEQVQADRPVVLRSNDFAL